jgi:hypothetical protein
MVSGRVGDRNFYCISIVIPYRMHQVPMLGNNMGPKSVVLVLVNQYLSWANKNYTNESNNNVLILLCLSTIMIMRRTNLCSEQKRLYPYYTIR